MTEAPFERGSATSEAAADSLDPQTLGRLERAVLTEIIAAGVAGCTDDELEQLCSLTHQTASARRRGLVQKGLVKDSGGVRATRSGRLATIWVYGREDAVMVGPGQPAVPARPSLAELKVAVEELRRITGQLMTESSYRPGPEFVRMGKWLSALTRV